MLGLALLWREEACLGMVFLCFFFKGPRPEPCTRPCSCTDLLQKNNSERGTRSPEIRNRVPKQGPRCSRRTSPLPPSRYLPAPPPKPRIGGRGRGRERSPLCRAWRERRGAVGSACPHPRPPASKPGDLGSTDPGHPDQHPEAPSPRNASPPRAAREQYPPRPRRQDRKTVRGPAGRVPLRSPRLRRRRSLHAGCCLSRGGRSIGPPQRGRRKPEDVAWVRGGVGTTRPPRPGQGVGPGAPSRRAALRARCRSPSPAPRAPEPREAPPAPPLAPDGRWPRPPPSSRRKVQCGEGGGGAPGPRGAGRRERRGRLPLGLGDSSRAPWRGVPCREVAAEGRPGKRWVAAAQGERIKFHGQEDTPMPPRFVRETAQENARGSRVHPPPSPRLAGGRSKHVCWALAEASVSRGGAGGRSPPLGPGEGVVCRERQNSWTPLLRGGPGPAFYLSEMFREKSEGGACAGTSSSPWRTTQTSSCLGGSEHLLGFSVCGNSLSHNVQSIPPAFGHWAS